MKHPIASIIPAVDPPCGNRLLAQLPAAQFARIEANLKPVYLTLGQVLFEPGAPLEFAFFPTTAIVSLVTVMQDGAAPESAIVGNDGVVGIALFLGGITMPRRSVVKSAGWAYRVPRMLMQQEFAHGGPLQLLLLRFMQTVVTQVAQSVACNRHHSISQQLCRTLLLSLDRIHGDELAMTQELIASMLGVRREGVTEAAGRLRSAGVIRYSRGHISVLDRAGLEARACECYEVVRRESERLLPGADRMAGDRTRTPELPPITQRAGRATPDAQELRC